MLVLTRKKQQQIRIGDNITITFLQVKGSTVRVGIDAPRNVHVARGELPAETPPGPRGDPCAGAADEIPETHQETTSDAPAPSNGKGGTDANEPSEDPVLSHLIAPRGPLSPMVLQFLHQSVQ